MAKKKENEETAENIQRDILGKMAGFLLKNANPSIVFHVKNGILKNITEEGKKLHEQVMREKIIQGIVACQKENGWLGNNRGGTHQVYLDLVEYMCRCGLYDLVPQLKPLMNRESAA